jgi:hypothetical protein
MEVGRCAALWKYISAGELGTRLYQKKTESHMAGPYLTKIYTTIREEKYER